MTTTIERQGSIDVLIITLPIAPSNSKSGKTIVIAGTSGFASANVQYDGKPVKVSVNAIVNK